VCSIVRHEFPPGSTWLVFTDSVPQAVLEGQFALEQTFLIPRYAVMLPSEATIEYRTLAKIDAYVASYNLHHHHRPFV
jgi:hypothetical protein